MIVIIHVVTMWVSLAGPPPVIPKMMSGKLKIQMTRSSTVSASVVRMYGMVIWNSVRTLPAPSSSAAS